MVIEQMCSGMKNPFELAPKPADAVVESAFDGTEWDAEALRDFALGQLLEVTKQDRVAQMRRQTRDQTTHRNRALLQLERFIRPGCRTSSQFVLVDLRADDLRACRTPPAADAIHRDGEQPARKRLHRVVPRGAANDAPA